MQKLIIVMIVISSFIISCSKDQKSFDLSFSKDVLSLKKVTIKDNKIKDDQIGYMIYDPAKKLVVSSHNRNVSFIPASVTKIASTIFALDSLKPDFKFKTSVYYTGDISNGSLDGNLYIKGTGDPLLTIPELMNIIMHIKKLGINRVKGKFIVDDSEFITLKMINPLMANDEGYNTSIGPLSLEFNSIIAKWHRAKKVSKSSAELTPDVPIYNIKFSKNKFINKGKLKLVKNSSKYTWLLSNDSKRYGKKRVPVKDPGFYSGYVFKKLCKLNGIYLPNPVKGLVTSDSKEIYSHKSRSLIFLVKGILNYSNNLMAEMIALKAAMMHSSKIENLRDSGLVVENYFKSKIKSVKWNGFHLENSSGLTSKNRISPEQMMAITLYGSEQLYGRAYTTLLPVSGWKGSLAKRLNGSNTFRVWAKTGTIYYALALAGSFYTNSGKMLYFNLFMYDKKMRNNIERIGSEKLSFEQSKSANRWVYKNKKLIDKIVSHWIKKL